jgi:hypothetical protein
LRRVEAGEGEEPVAGFFQAVGGRAALEALVAQEGLATRFDLGRGVGVDHVAIILGQLVLHVFRGVVARISWP